MNEILEKLRRIEQKAEEALSRIPGFVAIGYPGQVREAQEMRMLLSSVITELEGVQSGNSKQ